MSAIRFRNNLKYFLIFLLLPPALLQAQNKKQADRFFEENNYLKAREIYTAILQTEPGNSEVAEKAGLCYLHGSEKEKAETYLAKAVALNKKPESRLMFDYAEALHFNNKFDEAKEWYHKSDKMGTNRFTVTRRMQECDFGKKYVASPVKAEIKNMGNVVNGPYNDYLPSITADRRLLYFTSRRPGTKGGKIADDGQYYEDIYLSKFNNGAWTAPQQLPEPINSKDNDACVGISSSGQTMFIYRGSNGGDIYISELHGETWSKPEPFPFNTKALETSACLSYDEKKLYFVSDRGGNRDIYYSLKNREGHWGNPIKCPGNVNSPFDEESPFLSADGRSLYFSSRSHAGMGGYDIFVVGVNSVGSFGEAKNLGYPINTAADDLYFRLSPDGKLGYFSSEKVGGFGLQDLYTVTMPPPAVPPGLTLLSGTVKDGKNNLPTEATITVTDNETNQEVTKVKSNEKTGNFTVMLPAGKNYGITVDKDGRLFYSKNVTVTTTTTYEEITEDITLPEMKVGAIVVLRNLFFDRNKFDLHPESYPELDRVADLMKRYPKLKVEISGHTDNTGDAKANQTLSENRAKAAKDYLVQKGITDSRTKSRGFGSTKPAASNANEGGRQLNRRTEMVIIEM